MSTRAIPQPVPYKALIFSLAALVRLLLFQVPGLTRVLADQVELSTPLTGYKRVIEGVFLYKSAVPPFEGGACHHAPLLIALFHVLDALPIQCTQIVYITMDLVAAHMMMGIADRKTTMYTSKLKLDIEKGESTGLWIIGALYLFNPMTILSCVSLSTGIFSNTSVIAAIYHALSASASNSMFWLAIASYLSFYPAMLIFPINSILSSGRSLTHYLNVFPKAMGIFGLYLLTLLGISYVFTGSWKFMGSTYGVIIFLKDLTPNIGLFWYFFIEMFDQYRSFFLSVFQIHAFIYAIPLTIRLSQHPLLACTLLCGIMAIFKSYPSAGDACLYLGLLPVHGELRKYTRYDFLVANIFLYSAALAPIFWHLWIYAGSGNANFFYAITLVYNVGQIILLVDLLYSAIRRDFDVANPQTRHWEINHR
ncbi:hypothetical protein BZG36_02155 [Bifiguratus adelaidae]|uniref:Uncharacterized protein n=1 Tax=Bifiguratus adelaidae TaxID=1938954 RepID=A0A261Y326_9FUNG|nr:hypothetical protein BZG36_02155 [Bifiguratus adelaidae]